MARTFVNMPSFANVAAGATCTLNVPVGNTYDEIWIKLENVTPAQAKNVTLELDGKPLVYFKDGVRLNSINKHYGRVTPSGFLVLNFTRREMTANAHQRAFALGTADLKTCQLKIDLDGAVTSPAITGFAIKSPATVSGLLTKFKQFQFTASSAGVFEIDSVPRPPSARIAAIHLYKSDVSKAELEIDSVKVYELNKDTGVEVQKGYGRVPESGDATVLDFTLEGDPSQAIQLGIVKDGAPYPAIQDMRIRADCDTSGTIDVVVEYFDAKAGI